MDVTMDSLACVLVVILLCLFAAPGMSLGAVSRVWAVNDGEKVKRDDVASPNVSANSVWDGKSISIVGARNEVVAFQAVVEADFAGVKELSVTFPGLVCATEGASITYKAPGEDPCDYVGREIQVFSVNYMNVVTASDAFWAYVPGSPSAPKAPLGWQPVQLVPENARRGRGGFPLSVKPRQNQAIWFDVYIPKDSHAGFYAGAVAISADGTKHSVPVRLEVLDFTLPDENSMTAMVYYEPYQVELYQGKNLDAVFHRFAHRQRIELVHKYDAVTASAAAGRFRGSDFTSANGYEGPGEGTGNRILPASFYGPGEEFEEKKRAWSHGDSWMKFLAKEFPGVVTFLYMPDEPGPGQYAHIRRLAGNIHSNPGPGRGLPVFVTKGYVPELDGAIDVWCAWVGGYDVKRAQSERARGRRYWVYNGARPACGAILIDAPATDARAIAWACFKHGVDVYFFWHGNHWQHNWQKQGERNQNVWADPKTFDNIGQPNKTDQGILMGDGVLMYPGQEKLHPEEDRGIAGPCSTVQLANLRRGLQDHLYLTMARDLGLAGDVDEALQAVVPRVFSDAGETIGFAETGNEYDAARLKLARAIVAARKSGKSPGAADAGK